MPDAKRIGKPGKFELGPDHVPGIRVPKGGSSCESCEYLEEGEGLTGRDCNNKYYIEWHGSSDIPAPIDEFCSDWYEPKNEL